MEQRMIFQCEKCNTRFFLGNEGVKVFNDEPYKTKDGRPIFLTYYDCPSCDKRHFVQIDDTRSYQMKKEVFKLFRQLSKKKLDYKDIPKGQNERFKKLNSRLESYRFELKKQYEGKMLIDVKSEKEVEVHFSNV